MENKEYIALIDQYLSNQMSAAELNQFNEQVTNNPDLAALLKEYETTLSALNRNWIHKSWKAAAKKLLIIKIAAILLVTATLTSIGAVVYQKTKTSEKNTSIKNAKTDSKIKTVKSNTSDSIVYSKTELTNIPKKEKFVCRVAKNAQATKVSIQKQETTNSSTIASKTAKNTLTSLKLQEFPTTIGQKSTISEETIRQYEALKDAYLDPLKNAQTFTISNSKDTVIKGAKGIRVAIPANTLVDSNNQIVETPITLKLTEFVDAYDMFENGISTNYANGALASGGSCYLMAYKGEQELKIAPEKTIQIEFPTDYNPNMSTYYGKNTDTGVIWEKDAQPKYISYIASKPISEKAVLEIVKNDARGMFLDAPREDRSSRFCFNINAIYEGEKDKIVNPMLKDSFKYKKAFHYFNAFREFDKRLAYDMYKKYEKNLEGDTLRIHYKINNEGEIYKYNVEPSKKRKYKRKLKRFAKKQGRKTIIPNWDTDEYAFTLELIPAVNYTTQERSRIKTDSMLKDDYDLKQVLAKRQNRINIRNLGLANCDYAPRMPYSKPVQFSSSTDLGYMYIYLRSDNRLHRTGLNTTLQLKPMQSIDIVAIKPTPAGLQMSLQKNVIAKKHIKINQDFEPFDKKKVEKVLR